MADTTSTTSQQLPATMKALVNEGKGKPLTVQTVPTPQVVHGTVIVKVLSATVDPNLPRILSGEVPFTFPTPFTPGGRSVGRVVQIGPDTTSLTVGQLVLLECFIRGRDDPNVQILWGAFDGPSPQSKKLMADNYSMAAYAEFVRVPLENCYAVNEKVLCGELGYTINDLTFLIAQLVPYGGLRGIDLKAGERVIVAPATGVYSGAAVGVADAMGANVIAMGRNIEVLKKMQQTFPRIKIVQTKGNVEEDTAALKQFGTVDAYIDISPPTATQSTHVRSCFMALRQYARASLMGTISNDIAIPYAMAVFQNLTIRAQYMYEREDVWGVIKLAESGLLKMGKPGGLSIIGEFKLEEIDKAFEMASAHPEYGSLVVLTP